MGTYATTTSFADILVGTTLDSATTLVISKCITWAENEVNKKLAKRFDISAFQTTVPPHVTTMTERLALGYFHENNSRGGKDAIARAKELKQEVRDNLDELAAGKLELVNTAGSIILPRSSRPGVLANTDGYSSTFAEDDPLSWSVDSDKLDDISDNRE